MLHNAKLIYIIVAVMFAFALPSIPSAQSLGPVGECPCDFDWDKLSDMLRIFDVECHANPFRTSLMLVSDEYGQSQFDPMPFWTVGGYPSWYCVVRSSNNRTWIDDINELYKCIDMIYEAAGSPCIYPE